MVDERLVEGLGAIQSLIDRAEVAEAKLADAMDTIAEDASEKSRHHADFQRISAICESDESDSEKVRLIHNIVG